MLDMRAAISAVTRLFPGARFVSTNGYITRDLYDIHDQAGNFYLVGSMGMAAPVGLGIGVARPMDQVVVLDGDGSFAMNLGVLPMIAEQAPNLVHVVLDNGMHESTGGQRTVRAGDPVALALAAGYREAHRVERQAELDALRVAAAPALVHVRCRPRGSAAGRRVEPTPQQLVARFQGALAGAAR